MESIYLNICNGKTVIIDIRALQRECNNVDRHDIHKPCLEEAAAASCVVHRALSWYC